MLLWVVERYSADTAAKLVHGTSVNNVLVTSGVGVPTGGALLGKM